MKNADFSKFLKNIPKTELHIHLEGSIPIEALWELIKKYEKVSTIDSIQSLKEKFKYTNFKQFLKTWVWKNKFLREYDDFTFIAEKTAKSLVEQNYKYVEMFYTPDNHLKKNLEPQKLTEAVVRGFQKYADKMSFNLICDFNRKKDTDLISRVLSQINEVKDLSIIGIGIGGDEKKYPPMLFKEVFKQARNLGFRTTAHAGEAAGAGSIWAAIKELKVDRIGHGTRAYEDPELINFLHETQIPVEICVISNLKIGVIADVKEHPIKKYYEKGLNVCINTDDPEMFHTTLEEEYSLLVHHLGFTLADIRRLMENSINSAWCDEQRKSVLLGNLNESFEKYNIRN